MSGPTRSERRRALFDAALDLPARERAAFVRKAADDDPALRDELLGLLTLADSGSTFLREGDAQAEPPPPDAAEPAIYRILLGAPESAVDAELEQLAGADPTLARRVRDIVAWLRTAGEARQQGEDLLRRLRRLWSPLRHGRRYVSLGEIGSGGFGKLTLVRDELLGRKVAHKTIRGVHGLSLLQIRPDLVHRFLDEVQVAAQLSHPAIPPVHDVGVTEAGVPFFTMRYVRGDSLETLIARHEGGDPDWPLRRIVRLLVDVADALDHAHGKQVVHRDVKPTNVMVGRFGEVCVIDWGMAALHRAESAAIGASIVVSDRQATLAKRAMGTRGYTAPEQWKGESSPLCDVFSLGAVLCRALAGAPPDAESTTATPVLPSTAWRRDRRLAAIAAKALAATPSDRYESMAQMRGDLSAWLASGPLVALGERAPSRIRGLLARARRWLGAGRESGWTPPSPASTQAPRAPAMATLANLAGADRSATAAVGRDPVLRRIAELGAAPTTLHELGELAAGGVGIVSLGRDLRLQRKVAVKSLRRDGDGPTPAAAVDAFFDEARIAAQLDHPSVLVPYDVVLSARDDVHMLMPLARGGDLESFADRLLDASDGWRRTVPLLLQASRGLAWAHAKGVVHRDVKPANIVLGQHQDAYLTDWGLARLLPREALAAGGSILDLSSTLLRRDAKADDGFVGTPEYASPEQALGYPATRADDVFALGGVLFRLLTGRAPRVAKEIAGAGLTAWLATAQTQPIPPVRRVARAAPRALAAVCDRALGFRPEDRFVDAGEFALALEAALLRAR